MPYRALPTLLLVLALALTPFPGARAASPGSRARILMDAGWRFHLGDPPDYNPLGGGAAVSRWLWRAEERPAPELPTLGLSEPGWRTAAPGQDVFRGRRGFAWFQTTLKVASGASDVAPRRLHFESVDDRATVYL